jgi:hypothetical protein
MNARPRKPVKKLPARVCALLSDARTHVCYGKHESRSFAESART